jgi:hypothetical protein
MEAEREEDPSLSGMTLLAYPSSTRFLLFRHVSVSRGIRPRDSPTFLK